MTEKLNDKKNLFLAGIAVFIIAASGLLACNEFDSSTSPKPVAAFEVDRNGNIVQVFDRSTGANAWKYTWGDGTSPTIDRDATHIYPGGGTYVIRQTACLTNDFDDKQTCDNAESVIHIPDFQ